MSQVYKLTRFLFFLRSGKGIRDQCSAHFISFSPHCNPLVNFYCSLLYKWVLWGSKRLRKGLLRFGPESVYKNPHSRKSILSCLPTPSPALFSCFSFLYLFNDLPLSGWWSLHCILKFFFWVAGKWCCARKRIQAPGTHLQGCKHYKVVTQCCRCLSLPLDFPLPSPHLSAYHLKERTTKTGHSFS